jgi:DNA-binding transcriptional LysR family regulator
MSVDGPMIVNGAEFAVRAAADGLGLTYVPDALATPFLRSGHLIRVLEKWCPAVDGLFLRHAGHRQIPAAVCAFVDIIRQGHYATGASPSAMPGHIGATRRWSSPHIAPQVAA